MLKVVLGRCLQTIDKLGNDGIYLITYAVTEAKNKETCTWFLENSIGDIGPIGIHGWCFISDQQKGLLPTLANVVPDVYHRFYVRHLFAYFKKIHQGKELKDLMWGVAKSSTRPAFESFMKQMEIVSKDAHDELRNGDAILPPIHKIQPGKLKINRRRKDQDEASNSKEHFMGFRVQAYSAFNSQQSNAANVEGNLKRYRAGADGSQQSSRIFNSQQCSRT
ncbi:hypothetical protein SO802_022605 [Lithocarpus litseifolius]|uniref:MULE transposase domain-containing protein n=1 Tax=Lithocarpus litseifolius TaxID=425828 RepID=A0AAW2C5Q7_9ROSI